MKINWKKIIAREGLIMLSCFALTGLLIYVATFIPETKLPYKYLITTSGHKYVIHTDGYMQINDRNFTPPFSQDEIEIFSNVEKLHPEDFKGGIYSKVPDAMPLDLKFKFQGKDDVKSLFWNIIFASIFIYPIYLLVRFILWAVYTLKQKD